MNNPFDAFDAEIARQAVCKDRLPAELDDAYRARMSLAAQAAWPGVRAKLRDALRCLDASKYAVAQAEAEAAGVWENAQIDVSWAAEAYLDGHPPRGGVYEEAGKQDSCMHGFERAEAFASLGWAWPDFGDRACALAADRIIKITTRRAGEWSRRESGPDGTQRLADAGREWTRVCVRALLFPGGLGVAETRERDQSRAERRPWGPLARSARTEAACAAAVLSAAIKDSGSDSEGVLKMLALSSMRQMGARARDFDNQTAVQELARQVKDGAARHAAHQEAFAIESEMSGRPKTASPNDAPARIACASETAPDSGEAAEPRRAPGARRV